MPGCGWGVGVYAIRRVVVGGSWGVCDPEGCGWGVGGRMRSGGPASTPGCGWGLGGVRDPPGCGWGSGVRGPGAQPLRTLTSLTLIIVVSLQIFSVLNSDDASAPALETQPQGDEEGESAGSRVGFRGPGGGSRPCAQTRLGRAGFALFQLYLRGLGSLLRAPACAVGLSHSTCREAFTAKSELKFYHLDRVKDVFPKLQKHTRFPAHPPHRVIITRGA